MLRAHSISETAYSNLTFSLTDSKKNIHLVVLTFNLTDEEFLKEFNGHILRTVKKLKVDKIEESELEKTIKEFFVELNWQLFSKFTRLEGNYEIGLSLAFILAIENRIYLVQFGRMLSGVLRKNKFEYIGKSWDNFKIKTKEDLFLLGSRDEDIHVKLYRTEIDEDSLFISIPSINVENLKKNIDCSNLRRKIRYMYRKQNFPYVILATKGFKITPKQVAIKKYWNKIRQFFKSKFSKK